MLPPLLVFAIALLIYRLTLLPGVGYWDVAEFQAVPYLVGIAHPTGFPTYMLLGKLFAWLPVGDIAFRMNLLSALCAAGAAAGVTAVAMQLGVRAWLAIAAGLTLAFCSPFWESAVTAQPHTLHVLLVMILLALTLKWRETRETKWLAAMGLVNGLGLGNHMQFVMLLPALLVLVLLAGGAGLKKVKTWAAGIGAGLLGLSVYAYIPLAAMKSPPINYANPTTWERFRYLVLGEQFHKDMAFLSLNGLVNFPFRFTKLLPQIAEWLTPVGAILLGIFAIVGLITWFKKDWRVAVFFFLAWIVPLYNGVNYIDEDLRRYFFVSLAITAIAAVSGLQWLATLFEGEKTVASGKRMVITGLSIALAALPLALIPVHWAKNDRSHDFRGQQIIDGVFSTVKPNAVVISWWSVTTALWYGRYVDQKRTDIQIVDDRNIFDDGWSSVDAVVNAFYGKRPIYLIRFKGDIDAIEKDFELKPVGQVPPYDQPIFEVVRRR
jgi:4-amino-4-deoxy-L-arabinose transferase-like glycosyltransferase